jgi:hypothetical protein
MLLLALSLGSFIHSALRSPETPFLVHDPEAVWITNPRPVVPEILRTRLGEGTPAIFTRRFDIEEARAAGQATLRLRALGEIELELNGHTVPFPKGQRACLKVPCRRSVARILLPGENSIRARILNSVGPPALHLSVEGGTINLGTDGRWMVSMGDGIEEHAVRADDTRPYLGALDFPTPLAALRGRAAEFLALWAACALGFLAGRRFLPRSALRYLPELALVVLSVFWVFLFVAKFVHIPLPVGYDANFHLQYILYVANEHTLPLASYGWSMYHPPLYYVAQAILLSVFDPARGGVGEQWLLKLLPFVSGLGMVWITYAVAGRLFVRNEPAVLFAVLFAGTLPMNVYMSGYLSNEPLHAFLVSAAVLVAIDLMKQPAPSRTSIVFLSGILGLAILTKYTALLVVPIVVFFVGFNLRGAHGASGRRVASVVGGTLVGVTLLGGWVYLRNWIHFGDPLIWNLDLPSGNTWWQPPGFRTIDYYLGFGESLRHPFFSVFHSFWDAMYSGIWGEGLPPSVWLLGVRHGLWNYELMAAGYLLALPATAIVLFGFLKALRASLAGPDLTRRSSFNLLIVLMYVISFSVLSYSARVPSWGNIKAVYALCLVAPVAVCAGLGFSAVDRWLSSPRWVLLRAAFYGWFGTFLIVVALAYAS